MAEIVLAILGVAILLKGEVKVTKKRVVKGGPAYCLAILFLAGIPMGLLGGFIAEGITVLIAILATIGFVVFAKGDVSIQPTPPTDPATP